MDNQVIHQLVKGMAERGCNNKSDYEAFRKLSLLIHLTTQQSIFVAKRLRKYSDKQLPILASELGIKFDAEALDNFSRQPVADTPKISIMRFKDKYGPRIALHMPYNQEAKDELKNTLPFPQSRWEQNDKVWSIMDDEHIIRTAVNILKKHGYDFSTWLLTEEGYGSQTTSLIGDSNPPPSSTSEANEHEFYCYQTKKIHKYAQLNKDKLILRWPFIPNSGCYSIYTRSR